MNSTALDSTSPLNWRLLYRAKLLSLYYPPLPSSAALNQLRSTLTDTEYYLISRCVSSSLKSGGGLEPDDICHRQQFQAIDLLLSKNLIYLDPGFNLYYCTYLGWMIAAAPTSHLSSELQRQITEKLSAQQHWLDIDLLGYPDEYNAVCKLRALLDTSPAQVQSIIEQADNHLSEKDLHQLAESGLYQ